MAVLIGCDTEGAEEDEVMISRFGDTESHEAGKNCMTCHRVGGRGEGVFLVAGTVYREDGTTVNPGTTVRLLSNPDRSILMTLEVDARGNFYTTETLNFDGGLITEVVSGPLTKAMMTPVTLGACSACHGDSVPVISIPAAQYGLRRRSMMQSVNPATGQVMRTFRHHSDSEVDDILRATDAAFRKWRQSSFESRAMLMRSAAEALRARTDGLARMMVLEMGKPIAQARAEVEKCAWVCDYYAANAAAFLTRETVATDASESFVSYQPLGVILAVMPWNFPFWQVFRFAAPTLMAGNGAVLKHASNVPRCALAIEEIFSEAGFPSDLFRTLMIGGDSVGRVITSREVRAVSLTGSTQAGKAVAAAAGAVLKKVVLELGGSDPYVILEDADLPEAVRTCVTSRLINNGQSCIAAKRFIVPHRIRSEFERMFVEVMKAHRVGDPMQEHTDVGPLARVDLRTELHDQVTRSIDLGAECLMGGAIPAGDGAYYPPTVLANVRPGMPAFDEELFGPVAAVVPAADDEEAIELANRSAFGLGAAVFTRNLVRGTHIAEKRLDAGACFVNAFVRSDPRLPFGGIKESGYGRELGPHGIREFVNIKTVYVS